MAASRDMPSLLERLATLGDLARLRMLRLLDQHELSVGELAKSLQLPQSTVSRHLKTLHEGGWVVKRTEGTASLFRLVPESLDAAARELWNVTRTQADASREFRGFDEDDHRLEEVLGARRTDARAFFGRIGGEWDELRQTLFGRHFTCEALLSLLDESWTVADLGCGTGNALELLAPHVAHVIGVDREQAMIQAAKKRMRGSSKVEFRQGDLMELPLRDHELDAAVAFLVMPYLSEPAGAIVEMARVLKPGGAALIVDMVAHDRETYRHTMGHLHLGFSEEQIKQWAKKARLKVARYRRLRADPESKGPALFAALLRRI